MTRPTPCLCSEVKIGGQPTGTYNWNPDCPAHPWNDRLQAQSDRAVEMQRKAAAARKAARVNGSGTTTLYPCQCGNTLTTQPNQTLDCCEDCHYCGAIDHTWRTCPQKADDEGDQLQDQEQR